MKSQFQWFVHKRPSHMQLRFDNWDSTEDKLVLVMCIHSFKNFAEHAFIFKQVNVHPPLKDTPELSPRLLEL